MHHNGGHHAGAGTRGGGDATIDISLIVPTRNEAPNIAPFLQRVASIEFDGLVEVIFVDDSDDDTPAVVAAEQDAYGFDVGVIHRSKGQRAGGLGYAVVAGLSSARGEFVCILDADLRHPPERIAEMHRRASDQSMDLVVCSRYIEGGSANGSSRPRQALSRLAGFAAKSTFPRRYSGVTDPTSGFFLVRMSKIDVARIRGDGFKTLVEIDTTHPELHRTEIPYSLGERHAGEEKPSVMDGFRFLRGLAVLRARPRRKTYHYDIHGVIAVSSAARLPELKAFRIDHPVRPVDIDVRVGHRGVRGGDGIVYSEWFGRLGFALRIHRRANGTDIFVSRLVAMSPHVLYTNTVEPVLRWMFAEKGYALVHAACVEKDGAAFFITAQTDTGKTTTMLKVLDQSDLRFVSDDLTLIDAEGHVLPYPKPLTISAHTLHAVQRNRLTRTQRMTIPIQSRLHSKTGRSIGLSLANASLPAATMSAVVQRLIPPPKYHIEQLVPDVEVADRASVEWLFMIQRGGTGEVILEHTAAMDILLENCEDAYGFPPYPAIEPYLRNDNEDGNGDLRRTERDTIAQAFDGVPAVLLKSDSLDWAVRIEQMIKSRVDTSSGDNYVNEASIVDITSEVVDTQDTRQTKPVEAHAVDNDSPTESAAIG